MSLLREVVRCAPLVWRQLRRSPRRTALTFLGLVIAFFLFTALESLLYDVQSGDPVTRIVAAVSLVAIVASAAFLPAFRTGHIAPATALRAD